MLLLLASSAHSFNASWCEPPATEYAPLSGFDLVMVQIVTRHGARTPLHVARGAAHAWRCNLTELRGFAGGGRAAHVHVAFGASVFLGDCHFGQLTARGAAALRRLGARARAVYVGRLKFLPTRFRAGAVRVRSTLTHRTLHSALTFAGGSTRGARRARSASRTARRTTGASPRCCARGCARASRACARAPRTRPRSARARPRSSAPPPRSGAVPDVAMAARCDGRGAALNASDAALDEAAFLKGAQHAFVHAHESVAPLAFALPMVDIVNAMVARLNGEAAAKFVHWSAHDGNLLAFLGYLGVALELLPRTARTSRSSSGAARAARSCSCASCSTGACSRSRASAGCARSSSGACCASSARRRPTSRATAGSRASASRRGASSSRGCKQIAAHTAASRWARARRSPRTTAASSTGRTSCCTRGGRRC
jgi:acid phosphatase